MPRKNKNGARNDKIGVEMTLYSSEKYAEKIVSTHLRKFLNEKHQMLSSNDIEYLRKMRVAGRRFLDSLWSFSELIPEKDYKTMRIGFRKVIKSIGASRDLDTYIIFLAGLKENQEFGNFKKEISSIISSAKKKRLFAKKRISASIKELEKKAGPEFITNSLKALTVKKMSIDDLRAFAWKKISLRLLKFLSCGKYAKYAYKYKELHDLRLAAKHLRYTMENFDELYGGILRPYIERVRLMQDYLGDINNYHVWETIGPGLAGRRASAGLVKILRTLCRRMYIKTYGLFYCEWKKQMRKNTWQGLRNILFL
jgi:CHAD domain-containing protein